jgi:hypothetical protein
MLSSQQRDQTPVVAGISIFRPNQPYLTAPSRRHTDCSAPASPPLALQFIKGIVSLLCGVIRLFWSADFLHGGGGSSEDPLKPNLAAVIEKNVLQIGPEPRRNEAPSSRELSLRLIFSQAEVGGTRDGFARGHDED